MRNIENSTIPGDYLIDDSGISLARFTGVYTVAATITSFYVVFTAAVLKKVIAKLS